MDGAKVKDTSPNQGFSSKDFHLVQKLQGNYKEPSEGSFKTNSQNIYNSFDSPIEYRGFNRAADRDSGPTAGRTAVAAADRRTQQNAQGLQNAATGLKMGMDVVGTVFGAPGAGSAAKGFMSKLGGKGKKCDNPLNPDCDEEKSYGG